MKFVFLSVFYPFRGGISQFASALLKALKNSGHEVVALNFKRQYPGFLFPGKTQLVDEHDQVEVIESHPIIDSVNPLSFGKAARFVNSQQADVLVVNYWMTFFAYCQGYIAKKSRVKHKIAVLHNLIPHEKKFYDNFVNRYFLRQFDAFVVMSDQVKNDLLAMKPDASYIQLEHPNYSHFGEKIDREEALKQLKLPSDKKILLFFGLIRKYKGLDVLLEALGNLNEDYLLLIAGECYGDFKVYQDLIDSRNMQHKVRLYNQYIPDSQVSLYFSASDLCVLPYRSATQSGIVAAANQFEVPVIATKVGALPASVIHDREGLIVPSEDSVALKHAIERYFSENLEEKFIQNIQLKNKKLSWDFFSGELQAFIQKL